MGRGCKDSDRLGDMFLYEDRSREFGIVAGTAVSEDDHAQMVRLTGLCEKATVRFD